MSEQFSLESRKWIGFTLPRFSDWFDKRSFHCLTQSELTAKLIVTRSHMFSRVGRWLHVVASTFDWLTGPFLSFFHWPEWSCGCDFTTLINWKPLYHRMLFIEMFGTKQGHFGRSLPTTKIPIPMHGVKIVVYKNEKRRNCNRVNNWFSSSAFKLKSNDKFWWQNSGFENKSWRRVQRPKQRDL